MIQQPFFMLSYKMTFVLVAVLALDGCKKALQVSFPSNSFNASQVFSNDSLTLDLVTGIYTSMQGPSAMDGPNSIYLELGLAADELTNHYPDFTFASLYIDAFSPVESNFWDYYYEQIYSCNSVINGLPVAQVATASALRRQALGEAFFLRAFFLFYATNLYGEVSIPTSTDYRMNNVLTRSTQAAVYAQIISDLTAAGGLLTSNYRDGRGNQTINRTRPDQGAALALLARTQLYTGDWAGAEASANTLIAAGTQYALPADLNQVFLANSPEAIWQISPLGNSISTSAAITFILNGTFDNTKPVAMSPFLFNAFEPGDLRASKWIGQDTMDAVVYNYPYKYKGTPNNSTVVPDYLTVMRLGEQYLIRAEARAQQGDLAGAAADLNQLRSRAGLPATTAATLPQMLSAIAHERQVELFTEFGDRWFDLKRSGAIDSVMGVVTPLKGGVWNSYDSLFPVPASEIQVNPNLTQNPGY
jgi:starch-binding outer membrane protein, SusD/RagB family